MGHMYQLESLKSNLKSEPEQLDPSNPLHHTMMILFYHGLSSSLVVFVAAVLFWAAKSCLSPVHALQWSSTSTTARPFRHRLNYDSKTVSWTRLSSAGSPTNDDESKLRLLVHDFVRAYNAVNTLGSVDLLLFPRLLHPNCQWDDWQSFYQPRMGIPAIHRHLRLQKVSNPLRDSSSFWDWHIVGNALVVDDDAGTNEATTTTAEPTTSRSVGFVFSTGSQSSSALVDTGEANPTFAGRGIVLLKVTPNNEKGDWKIQTVSIVRENAIKSGEASLKLLSVAGTVIETIQGIILSSADDHMPVASIAQKQPPFTTTTVPEQYFAAWNARDMDSAAACFADDVVYDDTAFSQPFFGRDQLTKHLRYCARALPPSFSFVADAVLSNRKNKTNAALMVAWHVESSGRSLPFSRGISYYELKPDIVSSNADTICLCVDFVDSEPVKLATTLGVALSWIRQEPIRIVPWATWLAYMYIVFVSDGILPGANALQLEARTWEEVIQLSLNFFLVAPLLQLPFSPVVHPMLEGVFNVLLAWAAMFAGFLSDDRDTKPNLLPMLPVVVGMQFLTSAFLLPYLATRTSESSIHNTRPVTLEELPKAAQITESRLLGPTMALVGAYSVAWAFFGRWSEFGDLPLRRSSFLELLSIDRVGSSFLVDLVIFGLFQGWLVDDDLVRRGVTANDENGLRWLGKYVPFFGLAAYLALRPSLANSSPETG